MVGGGCYGTFYASQLAKAKARGKTDYRTVLVVDRNPECQALLGGVIGHEITSQEA